MEEFQHDIDHLILLHLRGESSEVQKNALKYWLSASRENKETYDAVQKIWIRKASMTTDQLKARRDEIWSSSEKNKSSSHHFYFNFPSNYRWMAAAVTLFLIFAGFGIFTQINKKVVVEKEVSLVFKDNPAGQKSTHLLPDGTKVWLNAMSSLEYPEYFSDSIRSVKIEGEAYFDVARDPKKPFIVESNGLNIEALGTAFNVKHYSGDAFQVVSLLEGKVRVSDIALKHTALLDPGFEIIVENKDREFSFRRIEFENSFGWKEGILLFNGDNFFTFTKLIERWFGVSVIVIGEPPTDWNIRAKYYNESLKNILRDISFNKNLKFEMNNKNIILKF